METIGKVFARADEAEARVKELEMFLAQVYHNDWRSDFNSWIEKKSYHGEQR